MGIEEAIRDHSTVLTVLNFHVEGAEHPPGLIAKGKGQYTAYFENEYGEQLVFVYDRKAKEGSLWHGDYSWAHPIEVRDGAAPDIILTVEEKMWLTLVWAVATQETGGGEQCRQSDT